MGVKPAAYLGVGAVGIVIGAAYWLMRPQGAPPETKPVSAAQKVQDSTLTKSEPKPNKSKKPAPLLLLGTVTASAQANITTMMPGKVTAVTVPEGATVRRGQVLIQLDDSDFAGQERSALAGVAAARTQVDKARAGQEAQRLKADLDILTAKRGLEQTRIKLRQADLGRSAVRDDIASERKLAQANIAKAETGLAQARKILASLEELAKVGGVPRNDLEGARTQVRLAESDRDAAKTQLGRLEAGREGTPYKAALAEQDYEAARAGVRQAQEGIASAQKAKTSVLRVAASDLDAARANLEQANAGLSRARNGGKLLRLASPIDGLVAKVDIRQGETAQPGMPLITLVSLAMPRVEALVSARQTTVFLSGKKGNSTFACCPENSAGRYQG